jgi:hypothetical protein
MTMKRKSPEKSFSLACKGCKHLLQRLSSGALLICTSTLFPSELNEKMMRGKNNKSKHRLKSRAKLIRYRMLFEFIEIHSRPESFPCSSSSYVLEKELRKQRKAIKPKSDFSYFLEQ